MTNIKRYRAAWSGFPGAPGVSTFYGAPDADIGGDLQTFFASMVGFLPPDVNILVESFGDLLSLETGDITGAWTEGPNTAAVGTDTGGYSAASGLNIGWVTSTIVNGRRLRGRTFIVPIGRDGYDAIGTLNDGVVASVQAAATSLIEAVTLIVWHRPTDTSAGAVGIANGITVRDKVAILKSRRD